MKLKKIGSSLLLTTAGKGFMLNSDEIAFLAKAVSSGHTYLYEHEDIDYYYIVQVDGLREKAELRSESKRGDLPTRVLILTFGEYRELLSLLSAELFVYNDWRKTA